MTPLPSRPGCYLGDRAASGHRDRTQRLWSRGQRGVHDSGNGGRPFAHPQDTDASTDVATPSQRRGGTGRDTPTGSAGALPHRLTSPGGRSATIADMSDAVDWINRVRVDESAVGSTVPWRTATRDVLASDVDGVVDFHGHMCVGLALGIRATELAMQRLGEHRHQGRVVVVAETRTCSIDAVQFLTGCTLGKGNLVVRDLAKTAFTFLVPGEGGVRVAARAPVTNATYGQIFTRLVNGTGTPVDRERFARMQRQLSTTVLNVREEDLFDVTPVVGEVPPLPAVSPSIPCPRCGELTMEGSLVVTDSSSLCPTCAEAALPR